MLQVHYSATVTWAATNAGVEDTLDAGVEDTLDALGFNPQPAMS